MDLENGLGNYFFFLVDFLCFEGLGWPSAPDNSSGIGGEPETVMVVGAGLASVVGAGLASVVGAGSVRVVGARPVSCSAGSRGLVGGMTSSEPKAHNISR